MFKRVLISILLVVFVIMVIFLIGFFDKIHKTNNSENIYNEYYILTDYPINNDYHYSANVLEKIYNDGILTNVIVSYPSYVNGSGIVVDFPISNGEVVYNGEPFRMGITNFRGSQSYVYNGWVFGDLGFTIENNNVIISEGAELTEFWYYLDFDATIGAFISLWDNNTDRKPNLDNSDVLDLLSYLFVDYPNWIFNYFRVIFYFGGQLL